MRRGIRTIVGLLIIMVVLLTVGFVSAQEVDAEGKLVGRWDFLMKCGKCHSIERPMTRRKTPEQWRFTVKTMHGKSHDWLTEKQVEGIIYFLSSKSLFESKCTGCHSNDRALDVIMNKDEWSKTVKNMQKKENSNISDKEADQIITYIYTIQGGF